MLLKVTEYVSFRVRVKPWELVLCCIKYSLGSSYLHLYLYFFDFK